MPRISLGTMTPVDYVIPFVDSSDSEWISAYRKYVPAPALGAGENQDLLVADDALPACGRGHLRAPSAAGGRALGTPHCAEP